MMRITLQNKDRSETHLLHEGRTVVGRDRSCDVVFDDDSLSRRHFECALTGDQLIVRDLGSKNGLYIGAERIMEARIVPGITIRAGNVELLFERETSEHADVPPPANDTVSWEPPEAGDGSRVGIEGTMQGYDEEEETPDVGGDMAEGNEDAAQVTMRGNRYFVRDEKSGKEVEILPRPKGKDHHSQDEQPTGELPVDRHDLPVLSQAEVPAEGEARQLKLATARRMRLPRISKPVLIAAGAIVVLIAAIVMAVSLSKPKPIQYITASEYKARIEQAIGFFKAGQPDQAVAMIDDAETASDPRNRSMLGAILKQAIKSDLAAQKSFETNCASATKYWTDFSSSSHSTAPMREFAQSRLRWLTSEASAMRCLEDARLSMQDGKSARALEMALEVPKESRFYDDANKIVTTAADIAIKQAAESAKSMDWTGAISQLTYVGQAVPAKKDEVEALKSEYGRYEKQRQTLEQAKLDARNGKTDQALAGADSLTEGPYAKEASELAISLRHDDALKLAARQYREGDGAAAIATLTKIGEDDGQFGRRIKAVMAARQRFGIALQNDKFDDARDALTEILQTEKPEENQIALEAKRNLEKLPGIIARTALQYVDKGEALTRQRDYKNARKCFEDARKLDPTNTKAGDGIKNLERTAMLDFNRAFSLEVNDPDTALQLFIDVRDRLTNTNPYYARTESEINRLELLKADKEKADKEKSK